MVQRIYIEKHCLNRSLFGEANPEHINVICLRPLIGREGGREGVERCSEQDLQEGTFEEAAGSWSILCANIRHIGD